MTGTGSGPTVHLNFFRLLGDFSHLASFLILFLRLHKTKNANGISLKTQELYFLVFVTRYLDLFLLPWHVHSVYNTIFKLFYLIASGYIVYMLRYVEPYRSTYSKESDTFYHVQLGILPCFVLALVFNEAKWSLGLLHFLFEICWAFSIYLEAIAIFPQLVLLTREGEIENITSHYIATLGAYRAFYLLNWIYRFFTETHYRAWIPWIAGIVQTGLYADFFYHYVKSLREGAPLGL
eukprot:gb/GECG01011749.1/.p1 GENE.gb/GECG01011749.1/~~gb/GECG01011749.1/.p1  ORF type:complete len:236 (+),score=4.97 gb/GECG01011749.1/:1-708(+)